MTKPVYFYTRHGGVLRCTPVVQPNRGVFATPEKEDRVIGVNAIGMEPRTFAQVALGVRQIMPKLRGMNYERWLQLPNEIKL